MAKLTTLMVCILATIAILNGYMCQNDNEGVDKYFVHLRLIPPQPNQFQNIQRPHPRPLPRRPPLPNRGGPDWFQFPIHQRPYPPQRQNDDPSANDLRWREPTPFGTTDLNDPRRRKFPFSPPTTPTPSLLSGALPAPAPVTEPSFEKKSNLLFQEVEKIINSHKPYPANLGEDFDLKEEYLRTLYLRYPDAFPEYQYLNKEGPSTPTPTPTSTTKTLSTLKPQSDADPTEPTQLLLFSFETIIPKPKSDDYRIPKAIRFGDINIDICKNESITMLITKGVDNRAKISYFELDEQNVPKRRVTVWKEINTESDDDESTEKSLLWSSVIRLLIPINFNYLNSLDLTSDTTGQRCPLFKTILEAIVTTTIFVLHMHFALTLRDLFLHSWKRILVNFFDTFAALGWALAFMIFVKVVFELVHMSDEKWAKVDLLTNFRILINFIIIFAAMLALVIFLVFMWIRCLAQAFRNYEEVCKCYLVTLFFVTLYYSVVICVHYFRLNNY